MLSIERIVNEYTCIWKLEGQYMNRSAFYDTRYMNGPISLLPSI